MSNAPRRTVVVKEPTMCDIVEALTDSLQQMRSHRGGPAGITLTLKLGRQGIQSWVIGTERKHDVEKPERQRA